MTPPIRMVSVPVDELAQEIRRVDGNHSLGAGALAEALLPFLSRFTAAPVREEGGAVEVKPLDWRKPSEFDRDNGHENAELIASGFGGTYAIQRDLANVILWRVDDPFTFDTLPTIEAAKAHAEADWRQTISRKITLSTREEAPAEAGSFEERAIALVKKFGSPNGSDYEQGQNDMGHRMVTMAREADAALLAQPQARSSAPTAREDAQPVAYEIVSYETYSGAVWVSPDKADEYRTKYGCVLRPLYTHPAPDALREANLWWNAEDWEQTFNSLEEAYDEATGGEMRGVAKLGRATEHDPLWALRIDLDTTGDGETDDYEIRLFKSVGEAHAYLAALQAEQKGGA